jgi:hypothetical protein
LLPHRSLGDDGRLATRFGAYGNDGPDRLDGADDDDLQGGPDDDVLCENQSHANGPGSSNGLAGRNYLSGGDGFDTLDHHAYTFYQDPPSAKPLFGGDKTIEDGYYPIEIQQNGLDSAFLAFGYSRTGDHDPNRPECVALTDMFGF